MLVSYIGGTLLVENFESLFKYIQIYIQIYTANMYRHDDSDLYSDRARQNFLKVIVLQVGSSLNSSL